MTMKTTEEYILEVKQKKAFSGRGYTYENTVYRGATMRLEFICPKHGEVSVSSASEHLNKNVGCPACGKELSASKQRLTTAQFVGKAKVVKAYTNCGHTYESTIYKGSSSKVVFTCPRHGEVSVFAGNHLRGRGGCPECGRKKNHVKPYEFEGATYRSAIELAERHGLHGKAQTAFLKRVGNFSVATQADIRHALDTIHTPNGQPIRCCGTVYKNFTALYDALGHTTAASYNSLRRYIIEQGDTPERALLREPNRSDGLGLVYMLRCEATGLAYIGQTTTTVEKRFYQHVTDAGKKSHTELHKAIAKHGQNAFMLTVLADNLDARTELSDYETAMIKKYGTLSPDGYNSLARGQSAAPQGKSFEYRGRTYRSQRAAAKAMSVAEGISLYAAVYRISRQVKTNKVISSTVKLNLLKAREIRALAGKYNHSKIAAMYGVSRRNVSMILNGKTWKEPQAAK